MAAPPIIVRPKDRVTLRLWPELAVAIGRNESIVLLQIEYLLRISKNSQDGRRWVYHSARSLKDEYFPFWSESTIYRALTSLVKRDLLIVGDYNRHSYDQTNWYSLNLETLKTLVTELNIAIIQNEEWIIQNGEWITQIDESNLQNGEGIFQVEPTRPEITSRNLKEITQEDASLSLLKDTTQWKETLKTLKGQMTQQTYDYCLAGTIALRNDENLIIYVAHAQAKDWLDKRLRHTIEQAVNTVYGQALIVNFEINQDQ